MRFYIVKSQGGFRIMYKDLVGKIDGYNYYFNSYSDAYKYLTSVYWSMFYGVGYEH